MRPAEHTDSGRHEPARRCIVSGAIRPRSSLLRFAVSPEGMITPDLSCRLPGRGIWVEPRRESLHRACDRNLFARSARRPVRPIDGLVDLVEGQLLGRCLDLLRMARRANLTVVGHDQVAAALQRGAPRALDGAVLATADDTAPRGAIEANRLAAISENELGRIYCLSADELGQPFDRRRVVHLIVMPGRLADRFLQEASRLAGMRSDETQEVGRE